MPNTMPEIFMVSPSEGCNRPRRQSCRAAASVPTAISATATIANRPAALSVVALPMPAARSATRAKAASPAAASNVRTLRFSVAAKAAMSSAPTAPSPAASVAEATPARIEPSTERINSMGGRKVKITSRGWTRGSDGGLAA